MKKILLSLFVIIIFVGYILTRRSNTMPVTNSTVATTQATSSQSTQGKYKDGQYTGDVADAFYGNIQVKVTIAQGNISDVEFLQYPNDRHDSVEINTQAMPILKSEAIQTQNAQVDIVSGATDTSQAFRQSLQSALTQATNS